jgi:hypothetical protein
LAAVSAGSAWCGFVFAALRALADAGAAFGSMALADCFFDRAAGFVALPVSAVRNFSMSVFKVASVAARSGFVALASAALRQLRASSAASRMHPRQRLKRPFAARGAFPH